MALSAEDFQAGASGESLLARRREVLNFLNLPFPEYSRRFLKIRTKNAGIQPFILNEGQLLLHEHTEAQMEARGYVRTILLKARQWGGCLSPQTPVLTADLRWIPIKDVRVGDELVACDEKPSNSSRKMQTATVRKIWSTRKKTYRITLDDGTSVVCSADHRWLSQKSQTQADWRAIATTHPDGVRGGLKVGDKIRTVADVWAIPMLDDAWFGGMIDGEGCFRSKTSGGNSLAVAQVAGPVLERMKEHCEARVYGHYVVNDHNSRKTKYGSRPVLTVNISNMRQLFRVMGVSRPTRFINKRWWDGFRMPDNGWRQIVSIEPGPEMDLIDIETSTGTFIANGWVSHNSTYIQGRAYRKVTSGKRGTKAFIMTHRRDTTSALFGMTKRFHDGMDDRLKIASPGGSATEMKFPSRDSMYSVGTAGSKTVGHGETVQFLHASEFALWPNAADHLNGIFQTVPVRGQETEIFIESTGKGMGNEFHRMAQEARKGNSDYWFLFVPWYLFPEYQAPVPSNMVMTPREEMLQKLLGLTDEQMAFRWLKIAEMGGGDIGEARFASQYPTFPEDAFRTPIIGSYYDALYVVRARKTRIENPVGVKIMGIDPSHVGNDRFSVCMRQGRKAKHVGEWRGKRTTESLGRCVRLIKEHRPAFVFVDTGGPGAGVCDLLMAAQGQLGCRVIPVNFGGSADDEERYGNKREEMYGRGKEWLEGELPVQIDDNDALQADFTNPQFRYDNAGRIQPESKQTMCKPPRSLPSPDLLESLLLTFAYDVGMDGEIAGATDDDTGPNRPINV